MIAVSGWGGQDEERWWPVQGVPKAVVRTEREFPQPRAALDMMLQSVAGTPAKIAREIRETLEPLRYDWVIAHAWSYFKKAPGADESAENVEKGEKGVRGYTPVTWCAERLPAHIRVVSPEELIWRIRMGHDPAQTRRVMETFTQ